VELTYIFLYRTILTRHLGASQLMRVEIGRGESSIGRKIATLKGGPLGFPPAHLACGRVPNARTVKRLVTTNHTNHTNDELFLS
jgi:hypothetical protein